MEYNNRMPLYIQEVYIWVLKMKQPLDVEHLSENEHVYMIELNNGELFSIDPLGICNFLRGYLRNTC